MKINNVLTNYSYTAQQLNASLAVCLCQPSWFWLGAIAGYDPRTDVTQIILTNWIVMTPTNPDAARLLLNTFIQLVSALTGLGLLHALLRFCNLFTHLLLLIQVYISDSIGATLKAEMNASNLNNCSVEHNRFFKFVCHCRRQLIETIFCDRSLVAIV